MGRIPIIIDCDPGVDDIIAVLLALSSPELDVLAIVVSYGNTDLESSHTNILKLYNAIASSARHSEFKHSTPIIAKGVSGPIAGEIHSAVYFHGRDGLGDINTRYPSSFPSAPTPNLQMTEESGVDLAFSLIQKHAPRSVTYLALGPLTNLYHVVSKDPTMFRERIGRVIAMGGALDVPGNTSPVAEFNFFADPFAVRELLTSPSPLLPLDRFLLLPLDITTPHELPFPAYLSQVDASLSSSSSLQEGQDSIPQLTTAFLQKTRSIMLSFGKDAMELHDIVAVWCAIMNPPSEDPVMVLGEGWKMVKRLFDIERTGELTRGLLVVDRRMDESLYEEGANREQAFLSQNGQVLDKGHIPALVEVEEKPRYPEVHQKGVYTIVATPGPEALLNLLLRRVWGV